MNRYNKCFSVGMAIAWACVGATAHASSACATRPPTQLVLAVDESTSITAKQRTGWDPAMRALVSQLCPGDRLEVFQIGSQTLNAKPFFAGTLPAAPPSPATIQELLVFKKALIAFHNDAEAGLLQATCADDSSNRTDILSLVDRIHRDSSRRLELIIFSDGIQANAELNLERVKLKPTEFGPVIKRVSARHGWTSATLSGASVQVVLPSIEKDGDGVGPNDRITLKAFYNELFAMLGAKLTSFETQVGGAL